MKRYLIATLLGFIILLGAEGGMVNETISLGTGLSYTAIGLAIMGGSLKLMERTEKHGRN